MFIKYFLFFIGKYYLMQICWKGHNKNADSNIEDAAVGGMVGSLEVSSGSKLPNIDCDVQEGVKHPSISTQEV